MGLLDGQRAIVTGGASGIGAATARMMTEEGAGVAIFDINGDGAGTLAKELDGLAYNVDVTDFAAFQAAVDDAHAQLGGLSLLYNNAGGSNLANVHEWSLDEWRRIIDLNLTGVFHGFKAAIPYLLAGR